VAEDEFQQILRKKLAVFGETLKPRERIIFQRRLLAEEPVKLQQLGDEFGVTREAVRLIEKKIVHRLKEYLQRELQGIREFRISIGEGYPAADVRGED
jgi:RNA polymerase sigma-32 factor